MIDLTHFKETMRRNDQPETAPPGVPSHIPNLDTIVNARKRSMYFKEDVWTLHRI